MCTGKPCIHPQVTVFDYVSGILVSVKNRADQKISKLKESYDHLVQRSTELQERNDKLVMPVLLYKIDLVFCCCYTSTRIHISM